MFSECYFTNRIEKGNAPLGEKKKDTVMATDKDKVSSSGLLGVGKHLVLGIIISVVLIYLAARGISWREVVALLGSADPLYITFGLLLILLMQALRSFRWGLLLNPLVRISQKRVFSISSVGFLAIIALPMRMGEIVRPYIMAKQSGISIASAISSSVAERVFDFLMLAIFIALFPFFLTSEYNFPSWLLNCAWLFLVLVIAFVVFLLIIAFNEKRANVLLERVEKGGGNYSRKAMLALRGFIRGLGFVKNWRLTLFIFLVSLLIWLMEATVIYFVLFAFGVSLPISAYLFITTILLVAIAIPAAPGFIGSWHYACVLGLSFFGVGADIAFAFGVLYHFMTILLLGALGLLFLPANYLALRAALTSRH